LYICVETFLLEGLTSYKNGFTDEAFSRDLKRPLWSFERSCTLLIVYNLKKEKKSAIYG